MALPLMPKATAVWLVENTSLTFEQISEFCGMHHLEVQAIADDEVAIGMRGLDPIVNSQLTQEEIERCQADLEARLALAKPKTPVPKARPRGARYTPVSKRQDRPDAIAWLVRNYPELGDAQISKLIGTTKPTINAVREKTHWNTSNIKPQGPVGLGLCSEEDLEKAVGLARTRAAAAAAKAEAEAAKAKAAEATASQDPAGAGPAAASPAATATAGQAPGDGVAAAAPPAAAPTEPPPAEQAKAAPAPSGAPDGDAPAPASTLPFGQAPADTAPATAPPADAVPPDPASEAAASETSVPEIPAAETREEDSAAGETPPEAPPANQSDAGDMPKESPSGDAGAAGQGPADAAGDLPPGEVPETDGERP